jgi:hypothetical protein
MPENGRWDSAFKGLIKEISTVHGENRNLQSFWILGQKFQTGNHALKRSRRRV